MFPRGYVCRYGVFVANYGGDMKLLEVGADKKLSDVAKAAGMAYTTRGRGLVAAVDIVSKVPGMDVFANNEWSQYSGNLQGSDFVFKNNGDGTYTGMLMTTYCSFLFHFSHLEFSLPSSRHCEDHA